MALIASPCHAACRCSSWSGLQTSAGGLGPPRCLPLLGGADGVQQDCQRPGVPSHIVGLGGPLLPVDMGLGRECPLPGSAVPDGPAAPGQDVRPVSPGPAVQDGLVVRCLQHQRLPLLWPGRRYTVACVPDAGALAERAVPRVGRLALRPFYASRDLRRAVVVDKTVPAVCQ